MTSALRLSDLGLDDRGTADALLGAGGVEPSADLAAIVEQVFGDGVAEFERQAGARQCKAP